MRVLVTGGLGVNGCWATRRFVSEAHTVAVLDRRLDTAPLGSDAGSVTLFEADITNEARLTEVFERFRPEVVVHMAALVGAREARELFDVNAGATVQLLDVARRTDVRRVVFTSSRAVYGDLLGVEGHPTYQPVTESTPFAPVRAYDVAKIAAEGMGQVYRRRYGLEFTALRFASIFGPGKNVRHAGTSIYSSMIDTAAAGEPVRIERGGDQRDDVIYVEDVAAAIVLAATVPGPLSPAYNISRGEGTTLHDLARAIRTSIPNADIHVGPGLDYFDLGVQYYSVLDNSLARRELGFEPHYDLTRGVARYLEASRSLLETDSA
ncbi:MULTISPECIES: NAD-dependent epimerase/dehydratase family protein [Streptomyces]|uniref:NAD-dependent epimerase/dehydratase family protein n=1 Tax=Streptomyces rhizosphaericus TaxID=114699 RepID=A0A6G4AIW4_9ACTN|nr:MULTISPECIES: NAD-dependent epimerase/dehydratase family protein [Streptomyces]NEW72639.1 NAD-dependent epimerase/dehydratase family protein [Streptomyces rhizosphaericus]